MESQCPTKKRLHPDSDDSRLDSPDPKKTLFDILDDSDASTLSHDLDAFMKTLQNEISPVPPEDTGKSPGSGSDDRPELGFLFEASDDELGLPPTNTSSTTGLTESVELSELWKLDEQFSRYDSFEYGFVDEGDYSYGNGEYVALDGLFDHTDVGFGSSDLTWRPETLPAQ